MVPEEEETTISKVFVKTNFPQRRIYHCWLICMARPSFKLFHALLNRFLLRSSSNDALAPCRPALPPSICAHAIIDNTFGLL